MAPNCDRGDERGWRQYRNGRRRRGCQVVVLVWVCVIHIHIVLEPANEQRQAFGDTFRALKSSWKGRVSPVWGVLGISIFRWNMEIMGRGEQEESANTGGAQQGGVCSDIPGRWGVGGVRVRGLPFPSMSCLFRYADDVEASTQ